MFGLDSEGFITLIIQIASGIAALAAIAASVYMSRLTKKFGTGILGSGFKTISTGVIFIAAGILIDALIAYIQLHEGVLAVIALIGKYAFFVAGTFIIVLGSKRTGDKMESFTHQQ